MSISSRHHYVKGGRGAHALRRLVHLGVLIVLWMYYRYLPAPRLIWAILGVIVLLEMLRLWRGWAIIGQRDYERNHISAFTWGSVSLGLVLLFAPGKAFAVPIIAAYAIGDPLLGELRQTALPTGVIIVIGIVAISLIWGLCSVGLGTPLWLALPMGIVTVAAEWPCLKTIDDNALMQLIPLLLVWAIYFINP